MVPVAPAALTLLTLTRVALSAGVPVKLTLIRFISKAVLAGGSNSINVSSVFATLFDVAFTVL